MLRRIAIVGGGLLALVLLSTTLATANTVIPAAPDAPRLVVFEMFTPPDDSTGGG
jgi:hypothetical protein